MSGNTLGLISHPLGGILFAIGALRLYMRDDLVGAVIFSATAILAIVGVFPYYQEWRKKKA
jgi:H+/Cl- antiporter ClcA